MRHLYNRYSNPLSRLWIIRVGVCIVLGLTACSIKAQTQLIPNPDFETLASCPGALGTLTVKNWYSPGIGTPDNWNTCNTTIPSNFFGYQYARSGNSYVGMYLYIGTLKVPTLRREYIGIKLLDSLVKDSFYEVSIHVSPGEKNPNPAIYAAAVSQFGFHFSAAPLLQPATGEIIPVAAQVENPGTHILNDTQNWMPVTGIYKASGGEQWLTMGNFGTLTTCQFLKPVSAPDSNKAITAYYYMDDASITLFNGKNTSKDTSVCFGDSIVFTAQSYWDSSVWNDGIKTGSRSFKESGTWWLSNYRSGTLLTTDTIRLSVLPASGTTKDTLICKGQVLTLQADNASSFLWNTGALSAAITVTDPGTYWVQRRINNCVVIDTFIVTPLPFPSLPSLKDTFVCETDSIWIGYPATNGYLFTWFPSLQSTPQVFISDSGRFMVRIDSAACSVYDTVLVNTYKAPVINLNPDTVVCFADMKQVELDAGEFVSYLWKPTGETTRTIYATEAMIYLLTVTDRNSCRASQQVLVNEECAAQLFFPNVFTPNTDGWNDVYEVRGARMQVQSFSMQIYNRWGVCVFSSSNIYQGWDGTLDHMPQPDDVYVLTATYSLAGVQHEVKMNITLLR